MAKAFSIDLSSFERLASRLKDVPDNLQEMIDQELRKGCEEIAVEARIRAPADDGFLQNGIGVDQLGPMSYNVFSNQLYSAYVEFGTRANVQIPDGLEEYAAQFIGSPGASALSAKEAIFIWCDHKGIDKKAWYAIYITLMTKGGKPHPFFFPAVYRILPIIVNRILQRLTTDVFQ